MENINKKNPEEIVKILKQLAQEDIDRLKSLPQPVIRVCGPWTTGGWGYEENLKQYRRAVKALEAKGYTVVDYFTSEETIKTLGAPHQVVMDTYHKPILQSGYIKQAFFMPKWEESKGTTYERNFFKDNTNIKIEELPEEWIKEER